ncbi:hypothetical protein M433DRAFT_160373 [Acidomyces richmondensis BFW]|nr:hypothetical protein M433DRAFT_160373 [Acidomyces richmondensis BFW]
MDKVSWVLAQQVSGSLRQQALDNDVRRITLQYRARGRQSRKEKDDGQLYLYHGKRKPLSYSWLTKMPLAALFE